MLYYLKVLATYFEFGSEIKVALVLDERGYTVLFDSAVKKVKNSTIRPAAVSDEADMYLSAYCMRGT
jgi:hypothetical protein